MAGDRVNQGYRRWVRRYHHGAGVFEIDWILSVPVPWTNPDVRRAGTIHVAGNLDETIGGRPAQRRSGLADRRRAGGAADRPDPTRAPDGGHIFWAYVHVPHGADVDMTEAIENQVERFAPGFRDTVVERYTKTAVQMEEWNPSYLGGDISNGQATLRQMLARPVPRWNTYKTPVRGVYMASAATPPGPAVHGACGDNAAQEQGLREIRFVARPDERDLSIQRVVQRSGLRGPRRSSTEMPEAAAELPFDPIDEAARQWAQRWDGVAQMHAVTSLMRVQQLVLGRLDELLRPHGLTFARYEALVLLTFSGTRRAAAGQDGAAAAGAPDLVTSSSTGWTRPGSSTAGHPEDGRAVLAEITDAGRAVVEAATADLVGADFGAAATCSTARRCAELLRRCCEPVPRSARGDFSTTGAGGSTGRR